MHFDYALGAEAPIDFGFSTRRWKRRSSTARSSICLVSALHRGARVHYYVGCGILCDISSD